MLVRIRGILAVDTVAILLGGGLGPAIARAYARANGGDVMYARGARFEFVFPSRVDA
jgi:signal transduction histidine kinase